MSHWRHRLAHPAEVYRLIGRLLPWLALSAVLILAVGLGWGLGFAPADRFQGEGYRIIYLHVPAAVWSMGGYALMALAALIGLVWQINLAGWLMVAIAPVGAAYTLIALVTGAAWGKPMWGTWWVWDARLTSELLLLFLYAGAIALYGAFDNRRLAARAAGILVLIGVVNLPVIHFSVEWWNTLHQGSTQLHQTLSPAMRTPLRLCGVGFFLLFLTMVLLRLRNQILLAERHRSWVQLLLNGEGR